MNRRGFLKALALASAVAVVPATQAIALLTKNDWYQDFLDTGIMRGVYLELHRPLIIPSSMYKAFIIEGCMICAAPDFVGDSLIIIEGETRVATSNLRIAGIGGVK